MASLTVPTPVIHVERKELEMVVHLQTNQDVTFHEGDSFVLVVDGSGSEQGVIFVKHAHHMSRGLTREWTLTLRYA
jgi:hypothetical protein